MKKYVDMTLCTVLKSTLLQHKKRYNISCLILSRKVCRKLYAASNQINLKHYIHITQLLQTHLHAAVGKSLIFVAK